MGACDSTQKGAEGAKGADLLGEEPAALVQQESQAPGTPLWQQVAEEQNATEAKEAAKTEAAHEGDAQVEDPPPSSEEAAKKDEEAGPANVDEEAKKKDDGADPAAVAKEAPKKKSDATKVKKRAASPKKAVAKAAAAAAAAKEGEKVAPAKTESGEKGEETPEEKQASGEAGGVLGKAEIKAREKAFKEKPAKEREALGKQLRDAAKATDAAECKRLLGEAGAVPSTADKDGWTPLMIAAEQGGVEACQVLLQFGADTKAVIKLGEHGMTALHYAARKGHAEVAKVLAPVSDLNMKNFQGRTAKEVAKAEGHSEIVKICRPKKAE